MSATTIQAAPPAIDPVEQLRHLTPQQVAEILSLKAAYVHELCRTGRIPAMKSGKYWMIPMAGLQEWLAYQERDVDRSVEIRLQSLNPPGDAGLRSRRSSSPRPPRRLATP
jgi:excisionase family DNA binding protein